MKKIIKAALFALSVAAFAALSGRLIQSMSTQDPFSKTDQVSFASPKDEADTDATPVFGQSECRYILREHVGKVCVFDPDAPDEPQMTLDVYVFTLPPSVAEAVAEGIYCDETELYRYIDALTS